MSDFVVVIPARLESERLPRKALLEIEGQAMIERVYRQASKSSARESIVATDAKEIAQACSRFDACVELTSAHHASGTDRIAEVARRRNWSDDQIIVNVQGDEPLIPPAIIDQVADLLAQDTDAGMATLMTPLRDESEYHDPNMAKVIVSRDGAAIYFSRAPIPFARSGGMPPGARRHVGIYAYRLRCLLDIAGSSPAPAELAERLEQLRALWLGHRIAIADAIEPPARGVDTQADLEHIRQITRQAASTEL